MVLLDWKLIAIGTIGIGIIVYYFVNIKEKFGGIIKGIRHIPFNDCERICDSYYNKCMSEYSNTDPGWCEERFKMACLAECYYTPYHRI